jgi:hypothetical protein
MWSILLTPEFLSGLAACVTLASPIKSAFLNLKERLIGQRPSEAADDTTQSKQETASNEPDQVEVEAPETQAEAKGSDIADAFADPNGDSEIPENFEFNPFGQDEDGYSVSLGEEQFREAIENNRKAPANSSLPLADAPENDEPDDEIKVTTSSDDFDLG